MTTTRAFLAALALLAGGAFAAEAGVDGGLVSSTQAASPTWPADLGRTYYGQERARAGTIEVELTVGGDGRVHDADTAFLRLPKGKRPKVKYALEEDFHHAAVRAALDSRFAVAADLCGVVRVVQEFNFDGAVYPSAFAGALLRATADEGAAVDVVLAPQLVGGLVIDPALAPRSSMARRLPFEVRAAPALAEPPPTLPARRGAAELVPPRLEGWDASALAAAADPRQPRQLVLARFMVGMDGKVSGVKLDQRHGERRFLDAVAATLASARFAPATRGGAPAAVMACQSFGVAIEARPPTL